MPQNLSVSIAIGAVLASGFASTLGSAVNGLGGLQSKIAATGKTAAQLGKALDLAAQKAALEQKAAAGDAGAAKALERLKPKYDAAAAAASRYGRTVAEWRREQEKATASLAKMERRLAAQQKFQANSRAIASGLPSAAAITGGAAAGIGVGMEFDTKMSRVAAVSGATQEQFAALSAEARKLGESTAWSASQAAEGMQFLSMAGFKVEDTISAMPGMLDMASAAGIDLGRAADIASNILTGFGLKASDMGMAGDVLVRTFTTSNTTLDMLGQTMKYVAPVAKAFGADIYQMSAMTAKLGDAGIQADQAGTALRQMMIRMAKPTKQVRKAMADVGITFADASGKMKPMAQILAEMAEKEKGMTEQQRLAANAAIFGTEAMSAGTVLMAQAASGALQQYEASLRSSEGTSKTVAATMLQNLGGDVTLMKSAFEGLTLTLYDQFQPALRGAIQWLTQAIGGVRQWAVENPVLAKTLVGIVAGIGGLATASLPAIAAFKTFGLAIAAVKAPFLALNLVMAANPIGLVVTAVAALAAGFTYAYTTCEPFRTFVDNCFASLQSLGSWLAGTFLGTLKTVTDAIATMLGGIAGVGKAADDLADKQGVGSVHSAEFDISQEAIDIREPHLASGGIATGPTHALIGEGREPEAVIPLSRLADLMPSTHGGEGAMTVTFAPVINLSGAGQDAYAAVRRGLNAGADDLRRTLDDLMTQRRRLAFD